MQKEENFLSYPINTQNFEVTINIKVKLTKKEKIKLLIDTGAQMSFLKYSSISNKKEIDDKFAMKFRGVMGIMKDCTLGIVKSGIYVKEIFCPHEFHVVNDYIVMGTAEGILGSDFLRKYESILSYCGVPA